VLVLVSVGSGVLVRVAVGVGVLVNESVALGVDVFVGGRDVEVTTTMVGVISEVASPVPAADETGGVSLATVGCLVGDAD
jgi:hypothetical protein